MLQHALKVVLIVVVLGLVVQDANAFGRGGGWGGGYGYGGCGYGGCGYGGCGYGGCGYGYGYGGYGYGGFGYGYGGYGYGYGGYGYDGRAPSSDSVLLTVNVPADAKVFINGQSTNSTGDRRQYTSTGLQPVAVYGYRVRVEFVRDGKPISEEKTVQLTAGQTGSLAFSAAPNAQATDMATSAVR
jgi:uncharacterized protein (TIGR03000 family)